jgi:hypothetical protein
MVIESEEVEGSTVPVYHFFYFIIKSQTMPKKSDIITRINPYKMSIKTLFTTAFKVSSTNSTSKTLLSITLRE